MSAPAAIFGSLYAAWGVLVIWKRAWFGRIAARSHRWMAQALPWLYGGRDSQATQDGFWTVTTVGIGALFIIFGGWIVLTQ